MSLIFDFNNLTLLKSKIRDTNKHTKEKIITLFFSKKGSILFFSNVVFVSRGERNHACCCFYVVKTKEEGIPILLPFGKPCLLLFLRSKNKRRRDTKIVSYAKKKIKASHTSREAFTPYKRKLRFVRGERNHACCCFYYVKTKEEGIPRLFPFGKPCLLLFLLRKNKRRSIPRLSPFA